jgi:hypothetical protein
LFEPYSNSIFSACSKVTRWIEQKRKKKEEEELAHMQKRRHGNRRVQMSKNMVNFNVQSSESLVSVANGEFTAGIRDVSTLNNSEEGNMNSLSGVLSILLAALKQGCGNTYFSSQLTHSLTDVDDHLMEYKKKKN